MFFNIQMPVMLTLSLATVVANGQWAPEHFSQERCSLSRQLETKQDGVPQAVCDVTGGALTGRITGSWEKRVKNTWRDGVAHPEERAAWVVRFVPGEEMAEGRALCADGSCFEREVSDPSRMDSAAADILRQASVTFKRVQSCEVDSYQMPYNDNTAKLRCKIDRLATMRSQEEAAAYYDAEIRPSMQSLLNCSPLLDMGTPPSLAFQSPNFGSYSGMCDAKRRQAGELIAQLAHASGDNPYLQTAVLDLGHYNFYTAEVAKLNKTANSPLVHPQERQRALQTLAQLESQYRPYFESQGLASPYGWNNSSYDFNTLGFDRGRYLESLNSLVDAHRQSLGLQSNAPTTPWADPRNARGGAQQFTGTRVTGGAPQPMAPNSVTPQSTSNPRAATAPATRQGQLPAPAPSTGGNVNIIRRR